MGAWPTGLFPVDHFLGVCKMKSDKRNKWRCLMGAAMLTLGLAALPSSETEAQSAAMPLSELGCDKLNVLNFQKMNQTQTDYAGQCAAREAAWAWEKQYGRMDENDIIGAVVYEP